MSTSSTSTEMKESSEIKPYQTMRGHFGVVRGVVHLHDRRHIITCSDDGSLRLWERESGAQIGKEWRDDQDEEGVCTIALSPSGETVASGSRNGIVKLWDIETRKIIAKWTGHTSEVWSVCWSRDGGQVVTGSLDGTARVWDVESGETVLGPIMTGHQEINTVTFSPDASNFATGGYDEDALKIWDARTGELLSTLQQGSAVFCLVWTSDQKKLFAGGRNGSIAIFDTATWQQIAALEDHRYSVYALSLFQNDRLLASGSYQTARLWNLDTNLPVGTPLQHQHFVLHTAFSADGRFLATACNDTNAYVWDVHTILRKAGLEDLLFVPNVTTGKSLLDSDATRRLMKPKKDLTIIPREFFDPLTPSADLPPATVRTDHPPTPRTDLHPSSAHSDAYQSPRVRRHFLASFTASGARSLLGRVFPRFRRSQSSTTEPTELLQQCSRPGNVSVPEPADIVVPAAQDNQLEIPPRPPHSFVDDSQNRIRSSATPITHKRPSSSIHRHRDAQAPPGSGAHAIVDRFLPRFRRPQSNIDASIELQQRPMPNIISGHSGPAVVEVPEIRDKQALFVAPRPVRVNRRRKNTWLARCVAFICCVPTEESGSS